MLVGDLADAVPVRAVATEVGDHDPLGLRTDHLGDALGIDLVGVGLDVDQHGDDARLHQRGEVGREAQDRCDDLVARLAVEQVDGQAQGGRPRVHHHPVLLGQQLGDLALELGHPFAQVEGGRAQDLHDGLDLLLVVNRSALWNPSRRHGVILAEGPPPCRGRPFAGRTLF